MCLEKIGRRTMPEEGTGYKVYEKTSEGYRSCIMKDLVLPNQWMLYKNPENNCGNNCKIGKKFFRLIGKRYEHGYHLFKTLEVAQSYVSHQRVFFNGSISYMFSIFGREYPNLVIVKVYYRGYIAEDNEQIVAKQIFVPVEEEVKVEQQPVGVV